MMLSKDTQAKNVDALLRTVLSLKNIQEARVFFGDLMTPQELRSIANRWKIVDLLEQGKPYREIAKEVGVSTTTVTRAAYWLKHGRGGFGLAMRRK